jgi:hypothetical protein
MKKITEDFLITDDDLVLDEDSDPEVSDQEISLNYLKDLVNIYLPLEGTNKTTFIPQEELLKEFRKTDEWEPTISYLDSIVEKDIKYTGEVKFKDFGVDNLLNELSQAFETTKNMVFFIHLLQKVLGQDEPTTSNEDHTIEFTWEKDNRTLHFYIGPTFQISCDGPLAPIRKNTRIPIMGWAQFRPYVRWLMGQDGLPLGQNILKKK